ncbi:unnamed protein product [Hyaloperonospora brassicae]|uniref:RxLR effector candidate protein n=1 Tax=Hyaloperonospora brassicae TaxID=162125 RepID=A0AAV0TUR3_HYABA|nr:unnamed protein product [Hyaloperonospora brassicae]
MHLSYIIAVLTTVGNAVCAVPDLQQLKSLSVADVAQPPVQITQSDPGVSKRSLRVHKLEDDEDDGDEDGEDEENKDDGDEEDKLSPTEEERFLSLSSLLGFSPVAGKSTASIAHGAALKRAEIAKTSYPLSTTSGAQAGRVSMQPATNTAPKVQSLRTKPGTKITPTLKSVDEGEVVTPARVDELLWGPKTVQKLDDVAEPAVSGHAMMKVMTERHKTVQKYKDSLTDPKMTAKKFRSVVDKDDLDRGLDPDVIYSTKYLSRWFDDIIKHSDDAELVERGKYFYKRINENPDALKRFGPLMDETRHVDDITGSLTRSANGASRKDAEAAELLVQAHIITKIVDQRKIMKPKLVEKAARKEQKAILQKIEEHAEEAVKGKWDLETMKKKLKVTDQTPRDSVQYKALNGLIVSRIKNDIVAKGSDKSLMDEAFEVVAALETNKLAQRHLVSAMSDTPENVIKANMGIGRPEFSELQQLDAAQAWVILLRARQLGRQIGL